MAKTCLPAGVLITSTIFWILGGYHSSGSSNHYLNSTEFIMQGQSIGFPGPVLPYAIGLANMCAVKLSEEEIFVIGGQDGALNLHNEVWIYNHTKKEFSEGTPLKYKRSSHSCSALRDGNESLIIG